MLFETIKEHLTNDKSKIHILNKYFKITYSKEHIRLLRINDQDTTISQINIYYLKASFDNYKGRIIMDYRDSWTDKTEVVLGDDIMFMLTQLSINLEPTFLNSKM